jgi:hypothetical protein
MYNISKHSYGYQLTFGGNIDLDEIKRWREESRAALAGALRGCFINGFCLKVGTL